MNSHFKKFVDSLFEKRSHFKNLSVSFFSSATAAVLGFRHKNAVKPGAAFVL
jgi:hypothetical protein